MSGKEIEAVAVAAAAAATSARIDERMVVRKGILRALEH